MRRLWPVALLLLARAAAEPTAVLFRTHVLDATVLALLRRLLADVLGGAHHVAVLFDRDALAEDAVRAFVDVAAGGGARGGAVELFGVGAADYVEGFGGKRGRPFAAEALNSPFKLKHDHPDVAYVLWRRAHRAAFRWVYAVECDVGFSGNFSAFVGAHDAARSEDLLAFHVGWRPVGWPFSARMSAEARALVGGPDGWAAWYAPLARYSDRALGLLDKAYGRFVLGCEAYRARARARIQSRRRARARGRVFARVRAP